MDDDLNYLRNYKTNHLYTIPSKEGAYAKLVGDSEIIVGELEVTERGRLAVSAFYVNGTANFDTLKLTKLKYHKKRDWLIDGSITINRFQAEQMKEFVSILSSLDLRDVKRTRISLGNLHSWSARNVAV